MPKSATKTFSAVLEPLRNGLGWVVARIPFDVKKTWPERRGLRVRGEIAGFEFRTALRPYSAGSGHFLLVNRKMQAAAKATAGSKVRIKLEPDLEERFAAMPPELAQTMKGDRRLRKWFDGLNDYTRRLICVLMSEPKSGDARERKAEQMAEWMLLTLEGELDPPPILKAAFQRQPLARQGWEAMSPSRRRNHLMGIFHYRGAAARERRAAQAIEDALAVARKSFRLNA
jgi:uncharacterized protein YdeI (YjbR/CyaY-like superfamily)